MNKKLGTSALALAFAGALATASHAQASTVHRWSAAHDGYTAYSATGMGIGKGGGDEPVPIVIVVRGIERLVLAPQRVCFAGSLGTAATGGGASSERLFDAATPH